MGFHLTVVLQGSSNRGSWKKPYTNEKKNDRVVQKPMKIVKTKVESSSTKAPLKGKDEAPKHKK